MLSRPKKAVYGLVARAHGLLCDERGQTLAEYGLLITVVAVGVIIPSMLVFRTTLISAFDDATACLLGSC